MGAGLVSGIVTYEDLLEVIDSAHESVFGVAFKVKHRPENMDSEFLEVPAWIRSGKSIDELNAFLKT